MLAKRYRLQIQDWLKDKSKKFFTRKSVFFIVRFSSNKLNFSRFGTIISAKVSKSAVKRNRIKRIIFDFIMLNKLNMIAGNDVVITVLPLAAKLSREEIKKEISSIFKLTLP